MASPAAARRSENRNMPLGDIALAINGSGQSREPTRYELLLRAFRADRGDALEPAARAELRAEVVRGLFVQAPGILVVEMAVAILIAAIFWRSVPAQTLVAWSALLVAASIVRWVHCRRYFERTRIAGEAQAWGRTFALGTLLSGVLWGIGTVVLFAPADAVLMIVLVFLVTGLSAAALTGYTAYLPAFYGFVLPAEERSRRSCRSACASPSTDRPRISSRRCCSRCGSPFSSTWRTRCTHTRSTA